MEPATGTPNGLTACPVLHQDRFILVINKPAGVLSHPNPGQRQPASQCAFQGRYDADERCFMSQAGRIWLIHRLDQDTSGVLLAALDARTAERCRELFENQAIQKNYLAVVRGAPQPAHGPWLDHLATSRAADSVRTQVIKARAPNAELHYTLQATSQDLRASLLDIRLVTGKTHQIRVQAASRQHPLAGDDVYGDFSMNRRLRASHGLRRLALHARSLRFKHPASGIQTLVEAPPPADLARLLVDFS